MALQQPYIQPIPEQSPAQTTLGVAKAFDVLAANLPGFEKRPEQYDLTLQVAQALRSKVHLVAEAPTGTGKSFAIGLAILAEFLGTNKKAVVATANNNLLEQYASKDLPFLQSLFPDLVWARAKGKNNYACLDKGEALFGQQVLFAQKEGLQRLGKWYNQTATGDKEEISFPLTEGEWSQINADDTCTGAKCPFYEDCHYFKAKRAVQDAQVIVTNHDLALMEILNPELDLFPYYDALILDEAHQLEDKTLSKLESSLTSRQIDGYINKAERKYRLDDRALLETIKLHSQLFFNAYRDLLKNSKSDKITIEPSATLVEATDNLAYSLERLKDKLLDYKNYDSSLRARKEYENLRSNIAGAARAARLAVTTHKKLVSWVEATKNDVKVVCSPYRLGKTLYESLFCHTDKVVITLSATLATNAGKAGFVTGPNGQLVPVSQFQFFRSRVGLKEASEFLCPSPFDYKKNCVLFLPEAPANAVDPNTEAWRLWMRDEIVKLLQLSQGRAFVLTTSSRAANELGEYLSGRCGFPVKAQNGQMSNSKLIEWFKETSNSVIVATASFWEGVSIEGDDLKLVIIDKIPFAPHTDPKNKALDAWYKADEKRKKRAFAELMVAPAIIRLKQGFGRLIRTKTDRGAVAIFDPRLTVKPYGKIILNALPNAVRVNSIEDSRLEEILR